MDAPKKFRASLFGYKKKDVNAYIMESAARFEKTKNELESENTALKDENKGLSDKLAVLEKERSYIADALLNAKQEAEKILAEAKAEAARVRAESELELEALGKEIANEKNRIAQIREDAKKALDGYISQLDGIDMQSNAKPQPDSALSEDDVYEVEGMINSAAYDIDTDEDDGEIEIDTIEI